MKRLEFTCMLLQGVVLAFAYLVVGQIALAQESNQVPDPSKNKILDLVFTVQDLGGKVQDLQVKETGQEIRIELAADVLFDFDKADLRPAAQKTLHQAADIIKEKAKGTVRIEGHTDSKGNDAYNQKLSERRAAAVKAWFINKEGLGNQQFTTQGFGAKKPVASNTKPDGSDDPDGRQKNRRVEIILKK
ncbi:MAG TPA: OmpA family protein [Pyrinomonadaceae bacterium]|jgi:outer membrane protein OmpA-like peptidoglycan-associated protein